ncbi:MAG: hypothetical protein ABI668_13400 [Sphingorhabdus sp.]
MNVFYFEIELQDAAKTIVAIFAKNADRASSISGRLMLNIKNYEPPYSGAGLALYRQSGNPEQLLEALAHATDEGIAGYTIGEGWSVLPVPIPRQSEWLT